MTSPMPYSVAMPVRAGALLLLCIAAASARAPMTNAQESGVCTDTRCGGAAWLCCEGSPALQDKTICSTTLDCDSCCGWVSSEPAIPRACKAPYDTYPFCDASLPLDKRVDDLISKLTLDEKPQLLVARNSPKGNISRLGIPEYDWGGNCIHGVQSRCAPDGRCPTSFPNPIGLGGTFNRSVWRQMGEVIGLELRALWLQGVGENHDSNLPHIGLDCWSPNIEIVRDPRWGRNLETPSEDPGVCGSFGVEVTKGLQESSLDPRYAQAIVTLKHFDANSLEGDWGPSGNITRHTVDSQISEYDLHSTYLPAFKRAVIEGGAQGVMCSYNSINGVPSCANKWLLGELLRGTWNFSGYVTSDSGAINDIYSSHHYTRNWTQTVTKALEAGCDIESANWKNDEPWATGGKYIDYGPAAIRSGELDEKVLDAALRNALNMRFKLGLFDPIDDQPLWKVPPTAVRQEENTRRAMDATQQSLVLLLNGGGVVERRTEQQHSRGSADDAHDDAPAAQAAAVLPFTAGGRVAVVGPHANDRSQILGNYLGQICNESFSSRACVRSPYEAIAAMNLGGITTNATGCAINSTDASGIAAAIAAARAADVVVYVGGLDTSSIEKEGQDRHEIGLPGLQLSLLRQLLALGKPLALVLFHGGIVTFPPDLLAAPNLALISAGYPGFYGALAIADALFDRWDPSTGVGTLASNRWGKTPLTWYSEAGWAAAQFEMVNFDMAKSPGRTYRYYTGTPQWQFGFGLNYVQTHVHPYAEPNSTSIVAEVLNLDALRQTDEIVLVFVRASPGTIPATEPSAKLVRSLVGFERLGPIDPGASASITFAITPDMVQVHNERGEVVLFPGRYDFVVSTGDAQSEHVLHFQCSRDECQPEG